MKKITVFGLGWLGLPLALALKNAGYQLIGTNASVESCQQSMQQGIASTPLNWNNSDLNDLSNDLSLYSCDIAIITVPPLKTADNAYIDGINECAAQLIQNNVKRIIFISSTSVYGAQSGNISEMVDIAPNSSNAKQLAMAEQMLMLFSEERLTVLRLSGLIGGKRHPALSLSDKTEIAAPKQVVNLVHRDDVIAAIIALLQQDQQGLKVYNLASPHHPEKAEYYSQMAQKFGVALPQFEAESVIDKRQINGEKITKETDFNYAVTDLYAVDLD